VSRSKLLGDGEGLAPFDIKSQFAQLAAAYSPGAFGHQGVLRACQ